MKLKKLSQYWSAQTHKWAKVFGDSILALGTSLTVIALQFNKYDLALAATIITFIGKVGSNFFGCNNTQSQDNEQEP